jgi:DNA-binding MarR family transcriptional regulator
VKRGGSNDTDPDVCNCSALRQAARSVSRLYDDALAPVGLGVSQYGILSRIGRAGESTIAELAGPLVMDRSTLGHLLRPLETRGLVKLGTAAHDRRAKAVALTPAGEALLVKARPLWAEAQRRFERTYGKAASLRLRRSLREVAELTS